MRPADLLAVGIAKTLEGQFEGGAKPRQLAKAHRSKPTMPECDQQRMGTQSKQPQRFEELEECRKRGFVTEEEYKQKRAMLLASF